MVVTAQEFAIPPILESQISFLDPKFDIGSSPFLPFRPIFFSPLFSLLPSAYLSSPPMTSFFLILVCNLFDFNLKRQIMRETNRNFLSIDWPSQMFATAGLDHAIVKNLEINLNLSPWWQEPKYLGTIFCISWFTLTGS